ncbi:response regulator transcription factor [Serratia fonticola]|uniref:response regulator transcription factor n=1 Tax=Serratia fonticola TaxID=47917 RepID=UPI003AAF337B
MMLNIIMFSNCELIRYAFNKLVDDLISSNKYRGKEVTITLCKSISSLTDEVIQKENSMVIIDVDDVFYFDRIDFINKLKGNNQGGVIVTLCKDDDASDNYQLLSLFSDVVLKKKSDVETITRTVETFLTKMHNPFGEISNVISHIGNVRFFALTKRENDILKRILSGMKNKEIAEDLFISSKTVGTHRSNIYSKFHVRTITELYFKLKSDSLIR